MAVTVVTEVMEAMAETVETVEMSMLTIQPMLSPTWILFR
jgi:hypothetical protein